MKNIFRKLFGTSLKSEIMRSINARIDNAQKLFDVEVKHANKSKKAKMWCEFYEALDKMKAHSSEYKKKKIEMKERHIESIISKLI